MTNYFSHDYDALNDIKMQNVLMEMGQEGVGIFWSLVEKMYKEGGRLDLSKCESYAFALHTDSKKIQLLINIIFEKDNEYFWSNSVLKRIKLMKEKSKVKKFAAKKRWENEAKNGDSKTTADAMQMHSASNADGKHNKENKRKETNEINNKDSLQQFLNLFNSLFGKKYQETQGRRKKLLARLKTYSIEQILEATKNLSASPFHRGKNDRNWIADPDFLIRTDEQIDKWINQTNPDLKRDIAQSAELKNIGEINNYTPTPEEKARADKAREMAREKLLPKFNLRREEIV